MKNFENFMRLNHIRAIKFESGFVNRELGESGSEWMVFPSDTMQKVLKVLLNRNNYNLLMIDKTNVLVGVLRKLCKWSCSSIIAEYRLLSGKNSNYYAEAFLDLVSIELHPASARNMSRRHSSHHEAELTMTQGRFSEETAGLDPDDASEEEELLSASPQVPKNLLRMAELRKKKKRDTDGELRSLPHPNAPQRSTFYTTQSAFESVATVPITLPAEPDLPYWFTAQRDCWEGECLSTVSYK